MGLAGTLARKWLMIAATGLLIALLAVAVACGDDDDDDDGENGDSTPTTSNGGDDGGGEIDLDELGGEIRIDGSSTVFPISEAMAEEFGIAGADTRVNVAFSGTGGGFEKFCRGETQISNASRPIKDEERQACADNDINDIVEFQVAIDALTVAVNPSNDFVDCLTVDEIAMIFSADGPTNWSEVRADFPDQGMDLYYPGTDSGTFDYFVEAILEGGDTELTHRGDGTASEDDNLLVQGIENDEGAIGYFGFAYFQEAGQNLAPVAIDGGEGCVEPTFDTALNGEYTPLSRPLFIYTRESFLEEQPEVLGFINFYLESLNDIVPEVGYVTMPEDLLEEQFAKLEPFLP